MQPLARFFTDTTQSPGATLPSDHDVDGNICFVKLLHEGETAPASFVADEELTSEVDTGFPVCCRLCVDLGGGGEFYFESRAYYSSSKTFSELTPEQLVWHIAYKWVLVFTSWSGALTKLLSCRHGMQAKYKHSFCLAKPYDTDVAEALYDSGSDIWS